MDGSKAIVSSLPRYSGDGYDFGGSVVLTIDARSFLIGESKEDYHFARQLADAWNAYASETKLREVAARAAAFIEEEQPPFDCPFSRDDLDTLRGIKTTSLL